MIKDIIIPMSLNSADMASLVPNPDDLLARSVEEKGRLLLELLAPYDSPAKTVAHSNFFNRDNDPNPVMEHLFPSNTPPRPSYGNRQKEVDTELMTAWNGMEKRGYLVRAAAVKRRVICE
jgi:hypothetical protein